MFVEYYYSKLAAFQDFMVNITTVYFPDAYPAVLYPGSSPNVEQANVAQAVETLGQGRMRNIGSCHGDCPDPISAGWARYLLIPSLAQASMRALAWHTGCEQQEASGPVFAAAGVPRDMHRGIASPMRVRSKSSRTGTSTEPGATAKPKSWHVQR